MSRRIPSLRPSHLPALILLCGAVLGALFFRDHLSFAALSRHHLVLAGFVAGHYAAAVLAFVAVYIAIVAFGLPGATVATLTGGYLFGLFPGVIYNLAGASLGAIILFCAVRAGFGAAVVARIDQSGGRIAGFRAALMRNEVEMLFLMRVTPVVPFFLANLLPALLNVRLGRFAATTVLGIIPGALVLTSVGAGLEDVFANGQMPDLSLLSRPAVALPIAGLVVLAFVPMILRKVRGR